MTNITPFKTIDGNKDKPPVYRYIITHFEGSPQDIIVTKLDGYCISTETLFCIVDENMFMRFMVPVSRLLHALAEPLPPPIDPMEIN